MFSFLNPAFLWAAAAALVPLLLHLMQKRRIVRMPFSTLRFLHLAHRRSAHRVRMENFVLWLLRTLLILCLALAFAMPVLKARGFGAFLGRANRDIAIVIDGSYSMSYRLHGGSAWETAIETARSLIRNLKQGDHVCVYVAADNVHPVVERLSPDRDLADSQVAALEPGTTASELAPVLAAAYDALSRDDRRREREVHVLTDGQALPWASMAAQPREDATAQAPARGLWDPSAVDPRTAVFVTLTGAEAPENVCPLDVRVIPSLVMAETPARVETRLRYSGAPRGTTVSLWIDGERVADRAAPADGDGFLSLPVPPLPPGRHPARIVTPADNLRIDDAFHFLIQARASLPALCVGSQDDTFFLRKALNPGGEVATPMTAEHAQPTGLPDLNLHAYAAVFLCDALPLSAQAVRHIEQYVRRGGVLGLFPGDAARPADYRSWQSLHGMIPERIADAPASARKQVLRWDAAHHPILEDLALGPGAAPVVAIRRRLAWGDGIEGPRALITAGASLPFLLNTAFGNGQIMLFAVSSNRSWSDFPLSPHFLPLTHQIVRFGAGLAGRGPYIWATSELPLADYLPAATREAVLLGPDEKSVPIRGTLVQGRTILQALDLNRPGIYKLRQDGAERPALAVNVDRAESDLSPIDAEGIRECIGLKRLRIARDAAELERLIDDHRVGKALGEMLLWTAFLLAVAEVVYANWRARPTAPVSDEIRIHNSGRVRTGGTS